MYSESLITKEHLGIMGDKGLIRTPHQTKKKKETVKQPVKLINLPSLSNYDIPQSPQGSS